MVRAMMYPPSHGDLVAKALDYVRQNHPNAWRVTSPEERQEEAEADAARCERYAQILISQGTFESQAWNMAIREIILCVHGD